VTITPASEPDERPFDSCVPALEHLLRVVEGHSAEATAAIGEGSVDDLLTLVLGLTGIACDLLRIVHADEAEAIAELRRNIAYAATRDVFEAPGVKVPSEGPG